MADTTPASEQANHGESLEPSPAQLGDTLSVAPSEWTPLDNCGTEIYVYGDQPVDLAVQFGAEDTLRQVREIAETWRRDPGAYPDGAADPLGQIADLLLGGGEQS